MFLLQWSKKDIKRGVTHITYYTLLICNDMFVPFGVWETDQLSLSAASQVGTWDLIRLQCTVCAIVQ